MYPVDTLKTRMQALGQPGQNVRTNRWEQTNTDASQKNGMNVNLTDRWQSKLDPTNRQLQLPILRAFRSVLRMEGITGLYRGVPAVALSAGPAHAVYFATYELAKETLGGNNDAYAPGAIGLAGAIATIGSDAIFTPADVVKQRLQLAHSPYKGVFDCIDRTFREEGVRAFFRSLPTTLVMNVPFTAVHFSVYESAKRFLNDGDEENEGFYTQLAAGGLAGGSAAAVTTPLDVVKTRLQTQGVLNSQRYNTISVLAMLRKLYVDEGFAGLTKGIRPRILFHAPSAAICWTTYETGKVFFCAN